MDDSDNLMLNHAVRRAMELGYPTWEEVMTSQDSNGNLDITPGYAKVKHVKTGVQFGIHIPYKKKSARVYLDLSSLGADVTNDARVRANEAWNANTRVQSDYILRTLDNLMYSGALEHYQSVVAEIEAAKRSRQQATENAELLARVLTVSTNVRALGSPWSNERDRRTEISINHGKFHLSLEADSPEYYRVVGHANSIPVDLMLDIAQVINRWAERRKPAAQSV